ncbi:MAG: hypothetical protein R6X31_06670 [Anaerolineae bacterium]
MFARHGDAIGLVCGDKAPNLARRGGVRDVENVQAVAAIGEVGIPARHDHVVGLPRRVVGAGHHGGGGIRDVEDVQPSRSSGDIGPRAG